MRGYTPADDERARAAANRRDRPGRRITATPRDSRPTPTPPTVAAIVADAADLARRRGRDDLARRLDQVAERVARTDTVVCVVGEFKKGKSALINALIGARRLPGRRRPRDDGRHGRPLRDRAGRHRPAARGRGAAHRGDPGRRGRPLGRRDATATTAATGVEVVEVGLPNPFLERGIALVDTPGVGGLNAAHAAATLAFLPSADALVFVTDASTELSRPGARLPVSRHGRPDRRSSSRSPRSTSTRSGAGSSPSTRAISTALGLAEHAVRAELRAARPRVSPRTTRRSRPRAATRPSPRRSSRTRSVGRGRPSLSTAIAQVLPALDQLREPLAAEVTASRASRKPPRPWPPTCATSAPGSPPWPTPMHPGRSASRTSSPRSGPGPRSRSRRGCASFVREPRTRSSGSIRPAPGRRSASASRPRPRPPSGPRSSRRPTAPPRSRPLIAGLLADEALGARRRRHPGLVRRLDAVAGRPDVRGPRQVGPDGEPRDGRRRDGRRRDARDARARCSAPRSSGRRRSASRRCSVASRSSTSAGGSWPTGGSRRARSSATFLEEVRFEADGRLASLLDDVQRQMRARFADRIARAAPDLRRDRGGARKRDGRRPNRRDAPGSPSWPRDLAEIDDLRDARSRRLDARLTRSPNRTIVDTFGVESATHRLLQSAPSIVLWGGSQGTVTG